MTEQAMPSRQDLVRERLPVNAAVQPRPLPWALRLYNSGSLRKVLVVLFLAAVWQAYGLWVDNELMFPTLGETIVAFVNGILTGTILAASEMSLRVLLAGYAIGVTAGFLLAVVATTSRLGSDFLEALTSMLNPLPAIALLPIAMLWFGLGTGSLVFVLVHAVLWPIALNAHAGFRAVPQTLRMVGRNFGLSDVTLVARILLPAAFPGLLAGLKIGWAFAWRTLIAAELVFGVSSGAGGLGWFLFENKNLLQMPEVFAGLLMVIFIGLFLDSVVFGLIEKATVRKWGMQQV